MKRPLTVKAYDKFKVLSDQLCLELRLRNRMRYGKTLRILESMYSLMVAARSWERRASHNVETGRKKNRKE